FRKGGSPTENREIRYAPLGFAASPGDVRCTTRGSRSRRHDPGGRSEGVPSPPAWVRQFSPSPFVRMISTVLVASTPLGRRGFALPATSAQLDSSFPRKGMSIFVTGVGPSLWKREVRRDFRMIPSNKSSLTLLFQRRGPTTQRRVEI